MVVAGTGCRARHAARALPRADRSENIRVAVSRSRSCVGRRLAHVAGRPAYSPRRAPAHRARLQRGNRARIRAAVMRKRQRGVAIVLAMGVVALAAMAAVAIMVSQSTWSRQVELTTDHIQARAVLLAGADWARAVLSDDRRVSNVDHLGEPWALRLPPMSVENGELVGQIEDQQGAFYVNNLVSDGKVNVAQLAHFRRLLAILSLPDALADALADWIDADSQLQPPDGAEDAYYLALDPPYLTANRPLIDVAELERVRGFND